MLRLLRNVLILTPVLAACAGLAYAQPGRASVTTPSAADSEREALKARIAALETALAEREARLANLLQKTPTTAPQKQAAQVTAVMPSPVAPRAAGSDTQARPDAAPSSSLPVTRALSVATAAQYLVPGATVLTVRPTGSMRPVFDERAVLLTEPAAFDDLKVGDIVTYRHPDHGMPIVHRIAEKHGDRFWTKGDGNARMDDVYVTRDNYQGRVFGIVYAAETPTAPEAKR